MKPLFTAALALALTGGAASAQMNPCNPFFGACSQTYDTQRRFYPPQVSSFPDRSVMLRNQNLQLQNELLRRQLQQGR